MSRCVKIAVCDDSPLDREILVLYIKDYLRSLGLKMAVDSFPSGDDFLSSDISAYGLVFLDMYMAGINGVETARRLVEKHTGTKIIFCSSSPEFVEESFEVEALRYLIKPVSRKKFEDVMNEFMSLEFGQYGISV